MKDVVLKRWISVVALVASMSVVWALVIPYGLPWTGLVWVTALGLFAMSAALWVGMRSARSMTQVIADTEAETTLAAAALASVPVPVLGAVNRLKGAGSR